MRKGPLRSPLRSEPEVGWASLRRSFETARATAGACLRRVREGNTMII